MAVNLYPLVFKPGIKRDGTKFQAEYCTNGQWIRFYQGKARKIGGMLGASGGNFPIALNITTIFPYIIDDTNYMFLGNNIDANGIAYTTIDQETFTTESAPIVVPGLNYAHNPNTLWQFISVSNTIGNVKENRLACFGSLNATSITNATVGQLTIVNFVGNNIQSIPVVGLNENASGGILYVAPTLFAYGNNGLLQWTSVAEGAAINNFAPDSSENISEDKVIFGASIRGGSLSPTLLFWTLSSVIRVTNIAANGVDYEFKVDPVTKDCSILSSRSVVEHNGLFFWPGTDNFYFYNGVVDVMVNTMNLRYFYDNIDMEFRQKVFGVKNKKYNEIWWFYPEKMGLPGRPTIGAPPLPVPAGTITRAIIYNLTENSWYDTQIVRDCGYWDNVTGNMYTFGNKLPPGVLAADTKYLWKHEVNVNELVVGANPTLIFSSFTTPTISWAAFNPMKQLTGVDRWMDVRTVEPDFVITIPLIGQPTAQITMVINAQQYAMSTIVESDVYNLIQYINNVLADEQKCDTRFQGRSISFTFNSSDMFEMGHIILHLAIGDGQ